MNYKITKNWTSVSSITGFAVGTDLVLQNMGRAGSIVEIILSNTEPLETDRGNGLHQLKDFYRLSGQVVDAWVRHIKYDISGTILPRLADTCLLIISDNDHITELEAIPRSMITDSNSLKVSVENTEEPIKVINNSDNDSIHRIYKSAAVSITGGGDTEILIEGMAPGNDRAYFEVLFWTDDTMTTLASPTAGAVVIEGAVSDAKFWRSIPDGEFLSSNDTRLIPEALGPMRNARITINSATDVASHASVTIDKY